VYRQRKDSCHSERSLGELLQPIIFFRNNFLSVKIYSAFWFNELDLVLGFLWALIVVLGFFSVNQISLFHWPSSERIGHRHGIVCMVVSLSNC
jgi:hypothetical protein